VACRGGQTITGEFAAVTAQGLHLTRRGNERLDVNRADVLRVERIRHRSGARAAAPAKAGAIGGGMGAVVGGAVGLAVYFTSGKSQVIYRRSKEKAETE